MAMVYLLKLRCSGIRYLQFRKWKIETSDMGSAWQWSRISYFAYIRTAHQGVTSGKIILTHI